LLGPDGPSLGGFVCPVTVTTADRWKLGQLAPGSTVRFVAVRAPRRRRRAPSARPVGPTCRRCSPRADTDDGILARGESADGSIEITYRRSGDDNVLVEFGVDGKAQAELAHELETLERRQSALEDSELEIMEERETLTARR
ncbi:biotin-dependent carboxyltransferase family protein, partial [Mycolicibacterium insubricum]|nr:hypothetical protein [Mycolicibacterium insubricum]